MHPTLRVARPTANLERISTMYAQGLGLQVLSSFVDHDGFDGVMIGGPNAPYHLEFTRPARMWVPRAPTPEHLLVFYLPDPDDFRATCARMIDAGFAMVQSHNPYWDKAGCTFEDPEGYRVVLQQEAWKR